MYSRVSIVKPLFKCRMIKKVECEGVAVVSDEVTLETITVLLVVNVDLFGILPLEPNRLLFCI